MGKRIVATLVWFLIILLETIFTTPFILYIFYFSDFARLVVVILLFVRVIIVFASPFIIIYYNLFVRLAHYAVRGYERTIFEKNKILVLVYVIITTIIDFSFLYFYFGLSLTGVGAVVYDWPSSFLYSFSLFTNYNVGFVEPVGVSSYIAILEAIASYYLLAVLVGFIVSRLITLDKMKLPKN